MSAIHRNKIITVCQGEFSVSADPNVLLSAVLGSCIATCLWDPIMRVGGMNHILLPGRQAGDREQNKYGFFAMEALVNDMMKAGAYKKNLVAWYYGGANTFQNALGIGAANAEFVKKFLVMEGIPIKDSNVGGKMARRVKFLPESGRVDMQINQAAPVDMPAPKPKTPVGNSLNSRRGTGDVELF